MQTLLQNTANGFRKRTIPSKCVYIYIYSKRERQKYKSKENIHIGYKKDEFCKETLLKACRVERKRKDKSQINLEKHKRGIL